MRRIVAMAFVSLDGVMQAPGGPEEDPTGSFRFGGWTAPLFDEATGAAVDEAFSTPFDLLLGRRTYDIFAAYWPYVPTGPGAEANQGDAAIARQFNAAKKYVATHRPDSLTWENSEWLGEDVVGRLRALRQEDGPTLLTQGSSELVHLLLANDLVDEIRLLTFPLLLGRGKRFFSDDTRPGALKLEAARISQNGIVAARYLRAGEVATGSFAAPEPSAAELERRRTLR